VHRPTSWGWGRQQLLPHRCLISSIVFVLLRTRKQGRRRRGDDRRAWDGSSRWSSADPGQMPRPPQGWGHPVVASCGCAAAAAAAVATATTSCLGPVFS